MARAVGMSDAEFRASTQAKVYALRDRMDDLDRRRDFFIAELIAIKLSTKEKPLRVTDVLDWQYPHKESKSVSITFNDAFGAEWVGARPVKL